MEMTDKRANNAASYRDTDPNTDAALISDNDVTLNIDSSYPEKTGPPPGDGDEELKYDPVTGDLILQKRVVKGQQNACATSVHRLQKKILSIYNQYKVWLWRIVGAVLLILFLVYVIYSVNYSGLEKEEPRRLLICTILGLLILGLKLASRFLKPYYKKFNNLLTHPDFATIRKRMQITLCIATTMGIVILIIALVAVNNPENLGSLAGLTALLILCYITSHNPAMIEWRPVFWGFTLQFYFAVFILKTRFGYDMFDWLGDRVSELLSYSVAGAKIVFGDRAKIGLVDGQMLKIQNATNRDGTAAELASIILAPESSLVFNAVYTIHFFAFSVLPVVVFLSAFVGILFYLGVMNAIICTIGRFLSFCLGTTPAVSINAAGNIFVGMVEAPLMIRPYIGRMTSSEMHAVMTGGFATIAGSVLGIYIGFGIPADHLLSASVMSAPAALAISKMTYPETEIPIIKSKDYSKMERSQEKNIIQAACNGAMMSAKICGAILVNVIAFLSLLRFVNATLTWFGDQAGVEGLTFELICSYVLYPIALFMGADVKDCGRLAELIGVKTFTNEFIAFSKLSELMKNRETFDAYTSNPNNTWHQVNDDIFLHGMDNLRLVKGVLQPRSAMIATYALCGFSNFGSMGVLLGGLITLAPKRGPTMSRLVMRSMIAGNLACFFTACIAGLFYNEFD